VPEPRPRRDTSLIILVPFLLASAVAAAPDTDDPLSRLRLSGVITVGGETRLGVLEHLDGGGRTVRQGDKLRGIGVVTEIGTDWLRIDIGDRTQELRLSGPAVDVPAPEQRDESSQDETMPSQLDEAAEGTDHAIAFTQEMIDALRGTSSAAGAVGGDRDFELVLIPLLGLSGDARLELYLPEDEMTDDRLARLADRLTQGEAVKVKIQENDTERVTYLIPEAEKGKDENDNDASGSGH
jgi:hypothetical protein